MLRSSLVRLVFPPVYQLFLLYRSPFLAITNSGSTRRFRGSLKTHHKHVLFVYESP